MAGSESPSSHEPFSASEILTCCALRFDGYPWQDDYDFDHQKAIEDFFKKNVWDLRDEEKLATFFFLQRGLNKFGLVYEPRNGKYWRAYRSLFFEVVHLPISEQYVRQDYFDEWQEEYAPRLQEAIECVRREHEAIEYDDDALPDLGGH